MYQVVKEVRWNETFFFRVRGMELVAVIYQVHRKSQTIFN